MATFVRNFIRSRALIDLIRRGQRTIEASAATAYYRELKPGDRVNYMQESGGDIELVCEIVDKQHFKTVGELIAAVGVERVVGAGRQRQMVRGASDGGEAGDRAADDGTNSILLKGWNLSNAVNKQGVLAFHLKVVEDMFSECEDVHQYRVRQLRDLQQMERGEKTIDARVILTHKRAVIPGDSIVFACTDATTSTDEWRLTCKAVAVKRYASFRELLEAEGIERCVPGCGDLEKAIKKLHRPLQNRGVDLRQLEQERGVVAIHLKPISALTKVPAASDERKKSRS